MKPKPGCLAYAAGDEPGHVVVYASRYDSGRALFMVTLRPEEVADLRDWLDAQLRSAALAPSPGAA